MQPGHTRHLAVVADDFGIGPNTSAGILQLAQRGSVTGSVLLVNSPYAEAGVRAWRQQGCPVELGWHPNLTLDTPILPPARVGSLVGPDGCFWPLGKFLQRWLLGRLDPLEIEAELEAQLGRFRELVGHLPTLVNTHQHVSLFPPVGAALLRVLNRQRCWPYVRRVQEPLQMLARVPGARIKRLVLSALGQPLSRLQEGLGFPGNEWLAGVTDPACVKDPAFFERWLSRLPGRNVELMCHPGRHDDTLLGRDAEEGNGLLERRVDELSLLDRPEFLESVRRAGFIMVAPSWFVYSGHAHARAA
jgi:predicted glycoside hydrolase/deacetylase ChbG (UPF0249 family)